jgi:hypothetical protein
MFYIGKAGSFLIQEKRMEIIKKALTLSEEDYYTKHLSIINPMLPKQLTPKEIEVMGAFMALKGEIASVDRFGTTCRKIVKTKLGLSDGGLGNYIKSLKEKGFILFNSESIMYIPKVLFADRESQGYMFKITKI